MRLIDRLLFLGMMLWVGSMLLDRVQEEFLTPPPPVHPAESIPRGAPDPDGLPELARGRVSELPVEHPRRGGVHVGTAWQAGDGIWLSARHVVDDCNMQRLGPVTRPHVARSWRHPDADLAAFQSATAPRSLTLADSPPRAGARGYGVGFPRGEAGIVELTLVGSARLRLTGAVRSERPFRHLLWRIDRLPAHIGSAGELGGISGGVVMDQTGRAVGVAFSTMPRRALLGVIPFADTRRAVEATGVRPASASATAPARRDMRAHAEGLLQQGAVSRVLCRS